MDFHGSSIWTMLKWKVIRLLHWQNRLEDPGLLHFNMCFQISEYPTHADAWGVMSWSPRVPPHTGEALGLLTCRSACGAPAHPLLRTGSLSWFDENHTPGRKPPLTKTSVSLPSEGRAARLFAIMTVTFSFCLNCQEIFEPVPPVKHLSNLCVTLLLPHPALVCRLSYQAHQAEGLGTSVVQGTSRCDDSVTWTRAVCSEL